MHYQISATNWPTLNTAHTLLFFRGNTQNTLVRIAFTHNCDNKGDELQFVRIIEVVFVCLDETFNVYTQSLDLY